MTEKNKLIWEEGKHSVGVSEMDDQHRAIFSIINDLFSNEDESIKGKLTILNKLIDYSNVHFSSEESMLHDMNYPDRFNHALLHDEYNKRLTYFLDHIDEVDNNKLCEFSMAWWENHILIEDMKYKNR